VSFFFSLHYILPFRILLVVLVHIIFLHEAGRRRKANMYHHFNKIKFHPYYSLKDLTSFIFILRFCGIIWYSPYLLRECDNFVEANPMVSPIHIKPE
jgi:ubiquinol-cytochrome c reductase cytochrome b subunit